LPAGGKNFLWLDLCEALTSEGKFLNSLWLLATRLVGEEDAVLLIVGEGPGTSTPAEVK